MRIVLTGSSTGIGRALAERLLSRGHMVWGLARSDQSDMVASHPAAFCASRCDVGVWSEVAAVAQDVIAAWSGVDGLVTCAGLHGAVGRAATIDPVHWTSTIRSNLDGTFHTLRAFADPLRSAPRRGKIVCFSGGGATKARPRFSAYAVAKAGIVRLVETIAEEARDTPLDINAVAPGGMNTRLTDEIIALGPDVVGDDEYETAVKQRASGGGSLERVLDLVEWLLSPASDGISGRLIAAQWDPWPTLDRHRDELGGSDIYTLRRIVPEDRGKHWT